MTPDEMRNKGMLVNRDGFWISEQRSMNEDQVAEDEPSLVER